MNKEHPIIPPPELIREWSQNRGYSCADELWDYIATQAARWGADQELEACCEWLVNEGHEYEHVALRDARRPKPPSLKEQALEAAQRFYTNGHEDCSDEEIKDDFDIIRRALESLPE